MARIRTIKPQHVNDKELSKISLNAHLFWVLSWCFSDDEGVMENDPLLLKSQLFPRRTDIRVEQVKQWIDQLIKARYLIPFEYNEEGYLLHRTFKVHQKIDRPQSSKIPSDIIRRTLDEHSTNDRPCIVKECIVKECKGEAVKPPDVFEKLELVYPFSKYFSETWKLWKDYKKKEHRFLFKSIVSEQASINELVNLSDGDEKTAIAIVVQSMAKGWKGFFELKNIVNGKKQDGGKKGITGSSIKQAFDEFYSQGEQQPGTG